MRLRTLAGLLGLLVGCSTPVSLNDIPAGTGTPTAGTQADTSGTSDTPTAEGDETRGTSSSAKLDLAAAFDLPANPLPPGTCPPDCQFELTLDWAYDGPAGPAPEPEDRVLALVDGSGLVTVAEQRSGVITLAQLDERGQELWTMPLALPCAPCRLVALDLHASGDLLLAGHGDDGEGSALALVARVQLGEPSLVWANTVALQSDPGVVPRAGPLVPLDEPLMIQPALEASALPGQEQLELIVYDDRTGALAYTDTVTTSAATNAGAVPRAAPGSDGLIVVSQPVVDGPEPTGELLWLEAIGGGVVLEASLPVPPLGLAPVAADGVVTLGQSFVPGENTLYLHGSDLRRGLVWSTTYVQTTDSASIPAMAMGQGHTYVATRIATRAPPREPETSIQLLRWSDEGELIWQVALPVATDPVDRPLGLQLPASQALVIAAFVQGARHVEQRRQTCVCD